MIAVTERLLFTILEVSLSTSCVIAALFLLSSLLRRRYSARWRYISWMVIAIRLLIPINITLPDAPMSISIPDQVIRTEASTAAALPELPDITPNVEESHIAAKPQLSTNQVLLTIWVAGMVGFLVVQTAIYLRFRRRLKYSRPETVPEHYQEVLKQLGAEMGLGSFPGIRVNTGVPTPLLMGLWRPTLLLPHTGYTDGELAFILRHELVHYRRHDLWYKLLLMVANSVHWFNPLVYLMVSEAGKDVEMSCDDVVITGIGSSMRADYCETILKTLPVKGWGVGSALTTSFGSLKGNTKMRIKNLYDRSAKRRGIFSFCAMILVTGLVGGLVVYTPVSAATSVPSSSTTDAQQIAAPTDPRLKLVEREFTTAQLSSQGISGVEVFAATENVVYTRGGDTLKVSYYQLSDSEYEFTTVTDGGGTRTYWSLLRQGEGATNDPQRTIYITVPEGFKFLFLHAATNSGDITFRDCVSYDYGIHAYSNSGDIALENCTAYGWVKAQSNAGDIDVTNLREATHTNICSDTGNVVYQPGDSIGNYHFEFNTKPTNSITVDGKNYSGGVFELNPDVAKTVEIESFFLQMPEKEEKDGAGTASFTIKNP